MADEPMLNPATGISNFTRPDENSLKGLSDKEWRTKVFEAAKQVKLEEMKQASRKYTKEIEPTPKNKKELEALGYKPSIMHEETKTETKSTQKQNKPEHKPFFSRLGFIKRSKKPVADRLKVMRLSNMLDKKRLLNQIQKLKLQRQIERLRTKGKVLQIANKPMQTTPQNLYPAYATPEVMGDIDSAFYADIGHADGNIFGNENYYNENFYDEDFWGSEFNTDVFEQLGIKPRTGVSPLLW